MRSVRLRGGPQDQAPAVPNYLPPEVDVGRRIARRGGSVANDTDETVLADRTTSWKIERSRALFGRGQVLERAAVARTEHATGRVLPGERERAGANARLKGSDSDDVGLAGPGERVGDGEVVLHLNLGRGVGEARDRLPGPRVDLLELGDDLEADPIARELERLVCRVGTWPDPRVATDCERLRATDAEEWPRDPLAQRSHARESGEAGSPREMKEDGFGLIVAGVAGRDRGRADLFRCSAQERVSGGPGGVLRLRRPIGAADSDGRAYPVGELRDEVRVLGALFGAGAVVEVRDVDDETELFREIAEDEQ